MISREVARNGGRGAYSAQAAQDRANAARRRVRARKLEVDRRLHDAVAEGLVQEWSPQQIAGRLAEEHPDDEAMRVSHEESEGLVVDDRLQGLFSVIFGLPPRRPRASPKAAEVIS
ncbi:hypothetical protein H1V43_21375 [Streptomyces sp. PSKA54]|uniref:Transposase n=1 Tax=Streptomyces himalayensis subsp. aureolus TaxID=2758039 RepID=A0A7W2HHC7_9ACTN|nr:hypothetical protein [Streptomyces himalayensis]MBA4863863.1 hypothetical protein [Streptomyces himalayensis subsp. aureolus]